MPRATKKTKMSLSSQEAQAVQKLRELGELADQSALMTDARALKLKKNHDELKKRYAEAIEEREVLAKKLELFETLEVNVEVPEWKPKKGTVGDATAVMVASDWHVEERVTAESVNGLNSYDTKEAERRAWRFFQKGLFMTDLVRKGIKVDRLILALLGDFISGYIHEELQENNQLSPTQAIEFATELLASGLEFLLSKGGFSEVIVPCCIGNHGRTTEKMRVSTAAANSFEYLMYNFLAKMFRKNDKVKFVYGPSYHTYVEVYPDITMRFHHGDAIQYNGGIGGVTIPVNKAVSQWNKHRHVYYDVMGHFHQSLDTGNTIINGSLVGYGPYSLKIKASFEHPQQQFMVIDRERGKLLVAPLFVD